MIEIQPSKNSHKHRHAGQLLSTCPGERWGTVKLASVHIVADNALSVDGPIKDGELMVIPGER